MSAVLQRIDRLVETLHADLKVCAGQPDAESVHHLRTVARRMEAALEVLVRQSAVSDEAHRAVRKLSRLLKKIRKAAGPVRDFDVHRKLLKRHFTPRPRSRAFRSSRENMIITVPSRILPLSHLEQQADDLEAWLKHERKRSVRVLRKRADRWARKLKKHSTALHAAVPVSASQRGDENPRAVALAIESFRRLSKAMGKLTDRNLHAFRKGSKQARYIAETEEEPRARTVADLLDKIQDASGKWHDWVMVAEEAENALGQDGAELIGRLEELRDHQYGVAIRLAEKIRRQLLDRYPGAPAELSIRKRR